MFDFDGTLAMIRAGWMPVMLDMMMETLADLGPDPAALRAEAEDYVARFTGKDTLYQMEAFAGHVRALGGKPRPAAEYKAEFIERLEDKRNARIESLNRGAIRADDLMVPGSRVLLENLRAAGIRIFLASGTAHEVVREEAKLLDIERFFEGIHGSAPTSLQSSRNSGIPTGMSSMVVIHTENPGRCRAMGGASRLSTVLPR